MRKSILVGLTALGGLLFAAPAFAGFATSVTGTGPASGSTLIAPPANAITNFSSNYQVWNEQQGTLSSAVTLDFNGAPGNYNGGMSFPGTTILSAGTDFGTTFVQLNPNQTGNAQTFGTATIHFSSAIIGIALQNPYIDQTDPLGAPGTAYNTGYGTPSDNRGIDRSNDQFSISADGKTLIVSFTANQHALDEIRVFTAGNATSVPEPASMLVWSVLGSVMGGGSWLRRRRQAAV